MADPECLLRYWGKCQQNCPARLGAEKSENAQDAIDRIRSLQSSGQIAPHMGDQEIKELQKYQTDLVKWAQKGRCKRAGAQPLAINQLPPTPPKPRTP